MTVPGGTDDTAVQAALDAFGLLAEESRLRVVSALVLGARTVDEVSAATGLTPRATMGALVRLEAGGVVGRVGGWAVQHRHLVELVRAAAPASEVTDHGVTDAGAASVLRAFMRDGRLSSIPSARSKRLVVLDHLVRVFEPGVRYPERDVNAFLRAFHPDCAALRRYLVDEGFLAREDRVYWRSGGTVEV